MGPRRVFTELQKWERSHGGRPTPSSAHYLSEYGWRDYLIYLAWKCGPNLFRLRGPGYANLPWRRDAAIERKLFEGRIGMPLIDAAVRQMMVTGFMSNRARQYVASYVIVELQLDWRVGAELFESFLLDYDVHANWGNWMRAAGVAGQGFGHGGSRWFNLAEERNRFDAKGDFIVQWVPEIAMVSTAKRHTPWTQTKSEQISASCIIGQDYAEAPHTVSKVALDGSVNPAEATPELFATTRAAKIGSAASKKDSRHHTENIELVTSTAQYCGKAQWKEADEGKRSSSGAIVAERRVNRWRTSR